MDATALCAEKAGAKVVRHIENCGTGAATMTGIEAARRMGADIIVMLDADEQHRPEDIPALLKPIEDESADIVLVKSDLVDVPIALKLSRATMRNIKQNLFFSFAFSKRFKKSVKKSKADGKKSKNPNVCEFC